MSTGNQAELSKEINEEIRPTETRDEKRRIFSNQLIHLAANTISAKSKKPGILKLDRCLISLAVNRRITRSAYRRKSKAKQNNQMDEDKCLTKTDPNGRKRELASIP